MRIIKIFFLLSVVLGACSEEQMLPGEGATSPEATFRLHEAEYSGDAGSGRYAAGGIVRSISGAAGYNRLEHPAAYGWAAVPVSRHRFRTW